jgi:hypothetical protein
MRPHCAHLRDDKVSPERSATISEKATGTAFTLPDQYSLVHAGRGSFD